MWNKTKTRDSPRVFIFGLFAILSIVEREVDGGKDDDHDEAEKDDHLQRSRNKRGTDHQ